MQHDKMLNEIKVGSNILNNKLKNLKEYDLKYGTDILPRLSKNLLTFDDIFTKELSPVNLSGYGGGGENYLNNEIESITNIYNDLLTKIANNQSGCGTDSDSTSEFNKIINKELKNVKTTLLNSKSQKQKKSKNDMTRLTSKMGEMSLKGRRKKKSSKMTLGKSLSKSKKSSKSKKTSRKKKKSKSSPLRNILI